MTYTLRTDKSWQGIIRDLRDQFDLWGISEWDTNLPRGAVRGDFNQTEEERTVTLTYKKNGKTITLVMGKQKRAVDNLRVLFLVIESLRLNEKRGMEEVMRSAYLQLAAPKTERPPHIVLQIMPGSPIEVAEAAYKALAQLYHPDKGGNIEQFNELTKAIKAYREAKK